MRSLKLRTKFTMDTWSEVQNTIYNFWIEHLSLLWEILPKVQWVSVPFSNKKRTAQTTQTRKARWPQDVSKQYQSVSKLLKLCRKAVARLSVVKELSQSLLSPLTSTLRTISSTILEKQYSSARLHDKSVSDKVWQWSDSGPKRLFSSQGGKIKIANIANYRRLPRAKQLYIRYYPLTVENISCFVFCDSVSCNFSCEYFRISLAKL